MAQKMVLRSGYDQPLTWRHPRLKQRLTHKFYCRECRQPFIALRDDARFCSSACKQANYRRRGVVSARSRQRRGPCLSGRTATPPWIWPWPRLPSACVHRCSLRPGSS